MIDKEVIQTTLLELNQDPVDCTTYSSFTKPEIVLGAKANTIVINPAIEAITTFIDLKFIESKYVFFSMSHYVINKLVKQEFFLKKWCQPYELNCYFYYRVVLFLLQQFF